MLMLFSICPSSKQTNLFRIKVCLKSEIIFLLENHFPYREYGLKLIVRVG
jgi:hypothetical protein